ncbi:CMD domain protein [Roseomonas eburnea]|uniref:CMD domain protein n=1 Tax=Neoroseomonas eburnea TaxID=1346889 RepID=A0A9X9XDT1_9PROT|nr:CMD domain protein [Neoroseomonas eburnea]MBR0681867.1 CMD domain protein [Neoroseomonas eburnea]
MTAPDTDLIDTLVGIAPGSPLGAARARRPAARTHAEASYRALLLPAEPGDVSIAERFAVAAYVVGLHRAEGTCAHYTAGLLEHGGPALGKAVALAVAETLAEGPKGSFPPGPLSVEDTPAPVFALSAPVAAALGKRLEAAFAHAHFLVFHPRDAAAERFRPLIEAGWTTDAIVTLSQLVSFLAFQIRVVAGLRVLAATP